MSNIERLEHRYFCNSELSDSVKRTLDSLRALSKISYSLPVTETLYFTYGRSTNYALPTGFIVRLRMYTATVSEVIEVSNDPVLLEIKRGDPAGGLNSKERTSIPGTFAVKALSGIDDCLSIRQQLNIPSDRPLLPTCVTQSRRHHWIHQSGLRITFDEDIRFFLFKDNLYLARMMTTLNEGKLEFKFPKANGDNTTFEEKIVTTCGCDNRQRNHLERRIRECIAKYQD